MKYRINSKDLFFFLVTIVLCNGILILMPTTLDHHSPLTLGIIFFMFNLFAYVTCPGRGKMIERLKDN